MILAAAIAAAVANAAPAPVAPTTPSLADAAHALEAGRLDQARIMISKAVASGATGEDIDRLVADLSFASGKFEDALPLYAKLLEKAPGNALLAERAGIAALKLGLIDRALALVARATESPGASWRAWNARAVIADLQSDWTTADKAYARAAELAPNQPEIANNRGWSQLIRGNWAEAIEQLERAVALGSASIRTANNLELARAAMTNDLPQRREGETSREWAERLNDAGVAAQLTGNRSKAIAAFTQALQVTENWYARAANNMTIATASQ